MKSFAAFAAFAASIASAQVTYNSSTGIFTCAASNPNGAYCAGASLENSIIIRCTNGVGQPGNCNDNLSGEFPGGLSYAPCWETSATSGDAACSKNCVVYGASGNFNGTFTLPNCTAISSSSSASVSSTVTSSNAPTTSPTSSASSQLVTSTEQSSSALSSSSSALSSSSSTTATVTTISSVGSTIVSSTYTTTYCPSSTLSSVILGSSAILGTGAGSGSAGSTGSPAPPSNGTHSTGGAGGASTPSTPTATPVGPTASGSFTGGATNMAGSAGSVLAAVGLAIAYFL